VAILVDQGVHWEGVGPSAKRVLDPPSAETLKVVKDVVSGVIGFQQSRGDQVLVETLPFDVTLALPAPAPPARPVPMGSRKPSTGLDELTLRLRSLSPLWLIAGGCFLIVALVAVGVLLKARLRRKTPRAEVALAGGAPLGPGTTTPAQLSSPGQFEAKAMAQLAENRQVQEQAELDALLSLKTIPTTRKSEVLKKFILDEAKKDPGKVAQLIRSWLSAEAV
jgi:flagellar M-ring protein FliF